MKKGLVTGAAARQRGQIAELICMPPQLPKMRFKAMLQTTDVTAGFEQNSPECLKELPTV